MGESLFKKVWDAHTVRVNNEAATKGQRLYNGDTVSLTPKKVAGAA